MSVGAQLLNICININAGELSYLRRWPIDHFVDVATNLLKNQRVRIFLIGGTGDREYVSIFEKKLPSLRHVHNVCGTIVDQATDQSISLL